MATVGATALAHRPRPHARPARRLLRLRASAGSADRAPRAAHAMRAEPGPITTEIDPSIEAQREHRSLAGGVGLSVDVARLAGRDPREVCREARGVGGPNTAEVGVRPGTDAEPLAVTPVHEVVERVLFRMRPVRDLVVAVSGACQLALRDAVEPSDRGVVGLRRGGARAPAPQDLPAAPGPVRDGLLGIEAELERIAGNVIHAKRDRRREIAPPRGFALTRPAEDQVKVDVKAFLADRGDRDGGVLGLMRAAERAKSFGREALRPDRSPGDSKCDPRLEARAVERRG